MNNKSRESKLKKIIRKAIQSSCERCGSCMSLRLLNEESAQNILSMVQDFTEHDLTQVIHSTCYKIRSDDENRFPLRNPTRGQIDNFAEEVAGSVVKYLLTQHTNKVSIPIQGIPSVARKYLHEKEVSGLKFEDFKNGESTQIFKVTIDISGHLIAASEDGEVVRINGLIHTIMGVGVLTGFFNHGIFDFEQKALDLDKANFEHEEKFCDITDLFDSATKNISDHIGSNGAAEEENAKNFLDVLIKLFQNEKYASDIEHSISWYCKSLGDGDVKTKFICRYIGFESLSGIWTRRLEPQDKSNQNKLKYVISALLAQNIDKLKDKEKMIKDTIDLRNKIFHGDNKLTENIHIQYARLGQLYEELFLHTIAQM
ncbi:MAG: hypothetical protein V3V61_07215 [Gammaproteobacteria bacterium]